MAKSDDVRSFNQIKAYPRGDAQGGRAIQAVKGNMGEDDGIDGHRTVVRETSEGRAIARTRDRMPMVEVEKYEELLYMETGALTFLWPGDGTQPHSGDCAKWRFLDVAPDGPWLGEVETDGAQSEPQPTPIDTGILRDNIDSLAIGYGRSADPAKDYEARQRVLGGTVAKKMMVGIFPATLWSGKFRLYLQAQYGAMQGTTPKLQLFMVGTTPQLRYIDGDDFVQFGLWAHDSPGIFTAPDGSYYLLRVTRPSGVEFVAHAYKLEFDSDVDDYDLLPAASTPTEERDKREAYWFAHSRIDLKSKREIGRFSPPAEVTQGALAYGWKWKNDGSQAGIVLTGLAGAAGDLHIKSTTVKLDFAYNKPSGQSASTQWFSMTGSATRHPDWIDGWGTYNIFFPEEDTGTRLQAFSLRMITLSGLRSIPDFSGVHIYGFYKDDVWEPVIISKSSSDAAGQTVGTSGGITPFLDMPSGFTQPNHREQGYLNPYNAAWNTITETWDSVDMTISCGSFSFAGIDKAVRESYWTREPGAEKTVPNPVSFVSPVSTGDFYGPHPPTNGSLPNGCISADSTSMSSVRTRISTWQFFGRTMRSWSLIIPGRDAEALYIATKDNSFSGSYSAKNVLDSYRISRFFGTATPCFGTPGGSFNLVPWCGAAGGGGWYGHDDEAVSYTEPAPEPPTPVVSVVYFDRKTMAGPATPGGSYEAIFTVDKTYPYYDRGMALQCSYNKRHWGSEGVREPASVPDDPNFVGWV